MGFGERRTLIGCAVGCGAVLLLAIGVAVAFAMWLNAPGEILEPQLLLGEDTRGYAELALSLDDPETAAFVERVFEQLQQLSGGASGGLPGPLGGWFASGRDAKTRRDLQKLFPAVAAWTLRPGPADDEDLHLLSVSLEKASHQLIMADWVLGLAIGRDPNSRKVRHADETIYELAIDGSQPAFFIDRGILFLTSDLETSKLAVDRIRRAEPARSTTPLDRLFAAIPEGRPLRVALTNERGEIERLWTRLAADGGAALDATDADALRGLTIAAELRPGGDLAATLEFVTPDAGFAGSRADALRQAFEGALPNGDYDFDLASSVVGDRIRLEIGVTDVIELLTPRGFVPDRDDSAGAQSTHE